jgi:cardiolipin synthase
MKYNIRSSAWFGFGILSLLLKGTAFAIPVEVANAPSDNLDLTVSAIQSAQQTLNLNIYELDSPQIVDAILNRIQAGVKVQILEEGGPVGGLSTAEVGVQGQLVQAMNGKSGDHLFEMKKIKTKRRYRYDHAKYAVIDGNTLLVGSENYSPTGNPVPGTLGNRGWEVVIHDASISEEFSSIFAIDADPSAGDVTELTSNQSTAQKPRRFETVEALPASIFINAPALTAQSLDASQVQRVTSPDTSLSGIVAAIQQAQTSIDIEQMTFDTDWKGAASSPVLDAVEAAAARGVKVRFVE